jgi:hypothetical protein
MTSRIKGNNGSQGRVVEVCSMERKKDGVCKGDFPMIKHALPWVQCFKCHSFGLDKFIKNALSDSGTIHIQTNVMNNFEFTTIAWDGTLFKNALEDPISLLQNCRPPGLRRNRRHRCVKVRGHSIWK